MPEVLIASQHASVGSLSLESCKMLAYIVLILGPNLHKMREEKIWPSSNAAFMACRVSSRGGRNKY